MKIFIVIDCDNSSFEDNPEELGFILRQVPPFLSTAGDYGSGKLRDSNGNTAGTWTFDPFG